MKVTPVQHLISRAPSDDRPQEATEQSCRGAPIYVQDSTELQLHRPAPRNWSAPEPVQVSQAQEQHIAHFYKQTPVSDVSCNQPLWRSPMQPAVVVIL